MVSIRFLVISNRFRDFVGFHESQCAVKFSTESSAIKREGEVYQEEMPKGCKVIDPRVRTPSVFKAVLPYVGNSLDVQLGHITDTLVRHLARPQADKP